MGRPHEAGDDGLGRAVYKIGTMPRVSALLAFTIAIIATPAFAAAGWDGTWAGNWGGAGQNGLQIIMAGNDVIGIYWHGDYLADDMKSQVSPDGKVLHISWSGGAATLTRDGDTTAKFEIHDASGSATGELKLDK